MLYHLPKIVREQCSREMRRVLKPGGRVLAVDFSTPSRQRRGVLHRMHRHGHVALEEIVRLLGGAGLTVEETGAVGVSNLHFAFATAADTRTDAATRRVPAVSRSLAALPIPRWTWVALGAVVVAGHAMLLHAVSSGLSPFGISAAAVAGVVVLILIGHFRFR